MDNGNGKIGRRSKRDFERRNSKISKKRIGLKQRRAETDFLLEIK